MFQKIQSKFQEKAKLLIITYHRLLIKHFQIFLILSNATSTVISTNNLYLKIIIPYVFELVLELKNEEGNVLDWLSKQTPRSWVMWRSWHTQECLTDNKFLQLPGSTEGNKIDFYRWFTEKECPNPPPQTAGKEVIRDLKQSGQQC